MLGPLDEVLRRVIGGVARVGELRRREAARSERRAIADDRAGRLGPVLRPRAVDLALRDERGVEEKVKVRLLRFALEFDDIEARSRVQVAPAVQILAKPRNRSAVADVEVGRLRIRKERRIDRQRHHEYRGELLETARQPRTNPQALGGGAVLAEPRLAPAPRDLEERLGRSVRGCDNIVY